MERKKLLQKSKHFNLRISYLSWACWAGKVGIKSLDLGRGTSRNQSWLRAASAVIRCKSTIGLSIKSNQTSINQMPQIIRSLPSQDHRLRVCSTSQTQHQIKLAIQWKMLLEISYAAGYTWKEKSAINTNKKKRCVSNMSPMEAR